MKLWLSPEFFDWNRNPLNPKTSQDGGFLKPYELLKHANKRLNEVDDKENPNEENSTLGEVVYHLRRAIEHREKQLSEKFNLSELPFEEFPPSKKNPRTEEKLIKLDVIKPILRRRLNRLRNIITHEQKDPYSKDKSEIIELSEFTWYFIRSTDSFLAREVSGTIFYTPDFLEDDIAGSGFDFDTFSYTDHFPYNGCFFISVFPKREWQVEIRGYELPITLFSKQEKRGWLELVVNHFDDLIVDEELGLNPFDHLFDEIPTEGWKEKRFDKYSSLGESIKNFEGTLIGPPAALRFMIQEYFELYMYY